MPSHANGATAALFLLSVVLLLVLSSSAAGSSDRGDIMRSTVVGRGNTAAAFALSAYRRNTAAAVTGAARRRPAPTQSAAAALFEFGRAFRQQQRKQSTTTRVQVRDSRRLGLESSPSFSSARRRYLSLSSSSPTAAASEERKKARRSALLASRSEVESVREIMSTPGVSLYEKLVRRLYMTNLFHPVKMGLKNIEDLHAALGGPLDDPSIAVVHVAGTNGKGSVALKTARSLELAGNTVGLFASPHVSSFRERMSIDGVSITEAEVERLLPRVYDACEREDIPATFFELTAALAFLYFKEGGCDAVVLETGLGGRLDATNVIQRPDLCVITSIGLEHTRILGETIPEIAREKGGIIKRGRPVLVGPHCPHDVLRECAEEKGAGGYYTCDDVLGRVGSDAHGGEDDVVDYDLENSRVSTAALALLRQQAEAGNGRETLALPSAEQIRKGTSQRPPCRFEQVQVRPGDGGGGAPSLVEPNGEGTKDGVTVVLDVAHNPDAMRYLVSKLETTYPNRRKRIVAGFSSDKDLKACGDALLAVVGDNPSRLHLVEAAHPRAARLEDILKASPALRASNFDEADRSITAQVQSALRMVAAAATGQGEDEDEEEVLVVCGSVFLMAEAREALGYDEPRDSDFIAEMAGANLRHGQENFGNVDPVLKNVTEEEAGEAAAAMGGR